MAKYICTLLCMVISTVAQALTLTVPEHGNVVGEVKIIHAKYEDTFSELARRYDLGFYEIVDANPNVDPWIPGEGTKIIIPTRFILPPGPHKGIVINLPELRLYYYSADGKTVTTHPVGIGSEIWPTPTMKTKIVAKAKDPTWTVPDSIMEEHKEQGDDIERVVGPGPDNPLGKYAMRLSAAGYLIHGTNRPIGIGRRVTHGCIRMYPEDIEELFNIVPVSTSVRIIHEPIKVGDSQGKLYLEAHPPLPEYSVNAQELAEKLVNEHSQQYTVDWSTIHEITSSKTGIPESIGEHI